MATSLHRWELADYQALADYWTDARGRPLSLGVLLWAVLHEWVSWQRSELAQLDPIRESLRRGLRLALSDAELRPWLLDVLRRDVSEGGRWDDAGGIGAAAAESVPAAAAGAGVVAGEAGGARGSDRPDD